MPAKPLSSFLGLTAVMCAIGSGGCGLEFEMVTTPEPVTAGSPLTYDIKATNVTSCPVKPSEFTLFPLLSEEQVAEINAGLADAGIAISLELLCALAGGQLPEGISGDLAQRAAALKATTPEAFLGDLPQTASQSSAFTAETLPTTCVETELDGTSRIDCELGPLASGGTEETQIVLIPTEAGVFLNVVFGGGVSDGVCDAGANEGNACSGADDCPDGNCDDGICVEGNNNALGCEGDQDCDGGTCVECDQCAVPGVCTEGEKRGLECSSDADCDSNPENGTCLCGVSIACTTTTVEEPTPTSTPTSTPTPTSTATPTPTATPTTTPVPDGGPCATTSECDTGLVCLGGICRSTAPAPTTSHTGLLVALGLLATIAALALWRRRDARRSPMAGGSPPPIGCGKLEPTRIVRPSDR